MYKEKRKRSARACVMERDGEHRRGSSYDRTDRFDGPGFSLNSQYTIPGNQNEPAFTTSREGTFPSVTIRSKLRRASSEETRKILVEAFVLKEPRDADIVYTCVYGYLCVYVCTIVKISPRRSVPDDFEKFNRLFVAILPLPPFLVLSDKSVSPCANRSSRLDELLR